MLRDDSNIAVDHTAIGQDIAGLLTQADNLVNSIGDSRMQDLLRETFKAFNGSGPELARLIQSSRLLVDEANANYGQTTQLIDQAGPFLDAQIRSGDDIKSAADGLARFTTELANADPQLRSVLQTVPGATQAANTTFDGIRPTFPMLAANLANFGRIGVIYHKSIEQALVIFPALMAALITVGGGLPADEGGKLDFKVDLGDPPPCSTGFIPPPQIRSPGRHDAARPADRPVLQDGAERCRRGARRAQLPVPGVPRQACPDHPAVPRPRRVRADRHQPVARSAGAVRLPGDEPAEHHAAQQVSLHPAGGGLRPGCCPRSNCRRACSRVLAPRRRRRSRCRCRRATRRTTAAVAVLRSAGPGAYRRTPARPPLRHRRARCPQRRRPRTLRHRPRHRHCPPRGPHRRPVVPPPRRTIRGRVCSSTRRGEPVSTPQASTNSPPRRRGWT